MTLVLVVSLYSYGLYHFTIDLMHPPDRKPERSDAIVALTGGSSRISEAVSLLTAQQGRRLLITGVNRDVNPSELVRLFPAAEPLMECCIDLDYRALNTRGNAVETGKWVASNGYRSVIVVTSDYHLPRALLELEQVLPMVRLVGCPVRSGLVHGAGWWLNSTSLKLLVSEYSKYVMALAVLKWIGSGRGHDDLFAFIGL